jgi:hypothetical protein
MCFRRYFYRAVVLNSADIQQERQNIMADPTSNNSTTMSHFASGLKSPRTLRIAKWSAGIFLVFGLLGYFAAPPA